MVPSLAQDNLTWSPHPPLTTPHGPLTRLGQPPLVPSLILNQLIKNDLDLFLLDRVAVAVVAGHTLIYIRIDYNRADRPSLWLFVAVAILLCGTF